MSDQARATVAFHNRIAVVFDYDDTLAPATDTKLFEHLGVDKQRFEEDRIGPLVDDGWDPILAKCYCLIEESNARDDPPLTRDLLDRVAKDNGVFEGVPEMFDLVRQAASAIMPDIDVEFYVLSSGFAELAKASPVAGEFTAIWGSEFHFNDSGQAVFPRQVVTHPEKVRYLMQMSKGLEEEGGTPSNVYRAVAPQDLHVPLDQVLYLGDGASDMPAFRLMYQENGMAIGLVKGDRLEDWPGYKMVTSERRVENLTRVDYREDSELVQSITLAVESICKRVALRKLGVDE